MSPGRDKSQLYNIKPGILAFSDAATRGLNPSYWIRLVRKMTLTQSLKSPIWGLLPST